MRLPAWFSVRRRWVVGVLAAVLLGLAGIVVGPQVALAEGLCTDAPPPVRPDFGTAGLTSGPRDLSTVPKVAPDPFTDPTVPISDVYGYSYRWTNYDIGCGSDFVRDPVAVTTTTTANVILDQTTALLAAVGQLEELSKSSSIAWISTVIAAVGERLSPLVLTVWLPLSLIALGALFIYRSRRAGYGDTLTRLLILVAVVAMSTFALLFPYTAAQKSDEFITFVGSSAGAGFNGSATDTIARQSVYKTWLVGNFGSADSATAQEYGPRLMAATTYSWSDVKAIDRDPAAKKGIDAAKAKDFTALAKELEDADPGAYESFTGRTDTRQGAALMGVLTFALMSFAVALSFVMMLLGRVVMQAMIIAVPVAGIIGVLRFDVLQRLWDLFTAAVVGVFKFTVTAGVLTLVLSTLQSSADLGSGVKLLAMLVITIATIMITKPGRTFKAMTPGLDPERRYLTGVLERLGTGPGRSERRPDLDEPERVFDRGARRPSETGSQPTWSSMPALPPAPYTTQPYTAPSEPQRVTVVAMPENQSDAPMRPGQPAGTGSGPQRWGGLTAVGPGQRVVLTTGDRSAVRSRQPAKPVRAMGADLDTRADTEDTSPPVQLLHRAGRGDVIHAIRTPAQPRVRPEPGLYRPGRPAVAADRYGSADADSGADPTGVDGSRSVYRRSDRAAARP